MAFVPSVRPSLTCVVGAGASVTCGMPTTARLTEQIVSALRTHDARGTDASSFLPRVERLLDVAQRYYASEPMNFEHLLDVLEGARALAYGWQTGFAGVAEACLTKANEAVGDALDPMFMSECIFVLKQTLWASITGASEQGPNHAEWPRYRDFWQRLADEYTLTVATLNYDTLIEQALGWDARQQGFAPIDSENVWRLDHQLLSATKGHRLFHLHGSIHLGRREYGTDPNRFCYEASFHEMYWHLSPESATRTNWGASAPRSQAGRYLEGPPLVTGLHKPDKLLVEPLASYSVEFANQVARSERLLVIGYGFADPHINAVLTRMKRLHGASRRVALIDFVDMVEEYGSTERHEMLVMLQRWSEEYVDIRDHPHPWGSDNGRVSWYWQGLSDVTANHVEELTSFLGW